MVGLGLLVGAIMGGVVLAIILPVLWLIFCKLIPPLRRRPGVSYGIAMALAFALPLITLQLPAAIGAPFVVALLYWQYRRAKAQLSAAQRGSAEMHPPTIAAPSEDVR